MGLCKDCRYYSSDTYGLFDRHYCTYHSSGDNYFFVDYTGSCNYFSERTTRSSVGYKDSGCFLTSACVDYQGKADDCEELTILRFFRDNFMRKTKEGEMLVKEYYEVAPKIVEHINCSDNKDKYYQYISEVIDKCVKLIKLNKNESALAEYKFMVENLSKEFALT